MTMKATTSKSSPEVRERAVWMVLEHAGDHSTLWAAVEAVAARIGCAAQTLREWTREAEVDGGKRPGVPSGVAERLRALERENRKLKQANEVLRRAARLSVRRWLTNCRSCARPAIRGTLAAVRWPGARMAPASNAAAWRRLR